jgi:hypothetical protein
MENNDFIFFVDIAEEQLFIKDKTAYPIAINDQVERARDEFGIAFFYSYDDWTTYHIDLSDFKYTTTLSASLTDYLKLKIFVAANYNPLLAYNIGVVVFSLGYFYYSTVDTNQNAPGHETWVLITEVNAYDVMINAFVTLGNSYAYYEMISEVPYIPFFSVKMTGEKDYQLLESYSGIISIVDTKLYDYENKFIEDVSSSFTLLSDGVYKVIINYTLNGESGQSVLIVSNFTTFITCVLKMVDVLTCEDEEEDCNGDITDAMLNEFSNVYFAIMMNINIEKIKFYGLLSESADKDDYIQQVGLLVKKAKLLVEQCKACGDE